MSAEIRNTGLVIAGYGFLKNLHVISAALICLVLVGCAYGQRNVITEIPVPSTAVHESEDGVVIRVAASSWAGEPRNLYNFVLPMRIEITNNTDEIILTSISDIVLIDEFNTQYNPLAPTIVSEIINAEGSSGFSPTFSIGIGGGYYGGGYYSDFSPYGFFTYYPVGSPYDYYAPQYENTQDVYTEALIPGPVYPDATISGFVYFKNIPVEVDSFSLDIGYRIEGRDERRVLSFPFTMQPVSY